MKTFHRLMYEHLTPEEYKELCRLKIVSPAVLYRFWGKARPEDLLELALGGTSRKPKGFDYWADVQDRLERQSQSDTINTAL